MNAAGHGLVKGKTIRVPAAHPYPKIYLEYPPGPVHREQVAQMQTRTQSLLLCRNCQGIWKENRAT